MSNENKQAGLGNPLELTKRATCLIWFELISNSNGVGESELMKQANLTQAELLSILKKSHYRREHYSPLPANWHWRNFRTLVRVRRQGNNNGRTQSGSQLKPRQKQFVTAPTRSVGVFHHNPKRLLS